MKVKANINGRTYERAVKTFSFEDGRIVRYIVVNHVPYIVQTLNGQPIGLMMLEQMMEEASA